MFRVHVDSFSRLTNFCEKLLITFINLVTKFVKFPF
jgi:hypothetical protein